MEVRALVAIAGTEDTYQITLPNEPNVGDLIPLYVDGAERDFVVIEVEPTGFYSSAPYLYGLYVKPKD